MHRFAVVVFCLLGSCQHNLAPISKVDISGDWQNGPPQNPNPVHYHVTQQGDNLTSDDPTYGHAVGHFTSPNQIVMKWSSAEWTGFVDSDFIQWSNQSTWLRRGEIGVISASVDVNAGQNNGATIPDCYPGGGAQCGEVIINDIPPVGPSGTWSGNWGITGAPNPYQASYDGPLGWGYCPEKSGGLWDCNHYAVFDNLNLGKTGVRIRFKNWASKHQKGTLTVTYWKWTP
jgi:hypothetical protein